MGNKEEIKSINITDREPVSTDHDNTDMKGSSPFKIYEDMYCHRCEDYRGCLGLMDSMTMMLQDSKPMIGHEGLDNMIKTMGGLTFSTRFKMILDCSNLRNYISKIKD